MDAVLLNRVCEELEVFLPSARVDKIHQPAAEMLILRLWTRRGEVRLLLSAPPGQVRMHLTACPYPNPPAPPRFCQLLRNRLGRVTYLRPETLDRVVRIGFQGPDGVASTLVVELFGSTGNLILLDQEERIIDALRRVGEGERVILPGRPYLLHTPTDRISLGQAAALFPAGLQSPEEGLDWIRRQVYPLSPLLIAAMERRFAHGDGGAAILLDFAGRMAEAGEPLVGVWKGQLRVVPCPLPELEFVDLRPVPSWSAAVEMVSEVAAQDPGRGSLEAEARRVVRRQRQRLTERMGKLHQEQQTLRQEDFFSQQGSLLLANLHQLRKGATGIRVENYFLDPPEPVDIALDPLRTPQENAAAYFQKAKKCRRGQEHFERRLQETKEELEWLDGLDLGLEEARSAADWDQVRGELVEAGLLRVSARERVRPRGSGDLENSLRQARTPGGYRLFWGKNPRTNDYVSKQLTARDDLWFHAQGLPGSHLVLKRDGRPGAIPEVDRLFAAALAAGYSRGRQDHRVDVIQAVGSAVRKPKGARPGLVTVEEFLTLRVAPRRLEDV